MTTKLERVRASWWVLLPLVPLGFLGWGALVYAGIRVRRGSWVIWGVVYAFVIYAGFSLVVATSEDHWLSDVGVTFVLVAWAATFVHALAIRSSYLERMELLEQGLYDRAEDRVLEREEARRLAREEPARALEMGVGRPDRPDSFAGGLVDLNNAPVAAIEELRGVNRALAERIVAVREEVDGFSSLEDLGHVLDLAPALLDRIRADVVLLPRGTRE